MIGMKTKPADPAQSDPVEAQRGALAEAEATLAEAQKELQEWETAREQQRREYDRYRQSLGQSVSPVEFGAFPSVAEGRDRTLRGTRLKDAARAAEERVRLARERLERAEQTMAPLSDAARARLVELARWVEADRELEARLGVNPCELMVSGPDAQDRLLAFAAAHGVEVAR